MTGLQTWLPLYIPHSWQENDVDDHRPKRDLLSLLHPLSMTRSTSRLFCRTRTFPASCPLRLCIHQVNISISSLFVGISLVVSAPRQHHTLLCHNELSQKYRLIECLCLDLPETPAACGSWKAFIFVPLSIVAIACTFRVFFGNEQIPSISLLLFLPTLGEPRFAKVLPSSWFASLAFTSCSLIKLA
jgi:hypothetical protein